MIIQLHSAVVSDGRFANRLISYVVAKELAASLGAELRVTPWIGECIFKLSDKRPIEINPADTDFQDIEQGKRDVVTLPAFFKLPHRVVDSCLTRAVFKKHLAWQSHMRVTTLRKQEVVAHIRRGDFCVLDSFPIVSKNCIQREIRDSGLGRNGIVFVDESDQPTKGSSWPFDDFLADFQQIMLGQNVFVYPRSSFSQVAALLGDGNVYMPYDYGTGKTTCRFRLSDISKPTIFPTRNNQLV